MILSYLITNPEQSSEIYRESMPMKNKDLQYIVLVVQKDGSCSNYNAPHNNMLYILQWCLLDSHQSVEKEMLPHHLVFHQYLIVQETIIIESGAQCII